MPRFPSHDRAVAGLGRLGLLELYFELRNRYRRARGRLRASVMRHAPMAPSTRRATTAHDTEVIAVGARRAAARPVDNVSSEAARRANLELLLAALGAAGVPHRRIDSPPGDRYRVAVAVDRTDSVLDVLRRHAPADTYLTDLDQLREPDGPPRPMHASRTTAWWALRQPRLFGVFVHHAPAGRADPAVLVLGPKECCELELWRGEEGGAWLHAPRWNRISPTLPSATFTIGSGSADADELPYVDDVGFPVDVVYTWVDGDDPDWRASRDATFAELDLEVVSEQSANRSRYESRDELRFSLRSLELYAPFVNHVWLVTADQRPSWLVEDHPRLTVVSHRDIFPDPAHLPTFNSHAIEANLHRIAGLSEHYVYMNDDFFFGRRLAAECFFLANGLEQFFLSRARMPVGRPTAATKPVDAAAMTGRDLLADHFGVRVTRKFRHAPYAQRRSVHDDIARRFPEAVNRTSASRVRAPDDLPIASSFQHYVAYLTGKGVPGVIESRYVDLALPNLESRLYDLGAEPWVDAICLNDTVSTDEQFDHQRELVGTFLERRFPWKSSFER